MTQSGYICSGAGMHTGKPRKKMVEKAQQEELWKTKK